MMTGEDLQQFKGYLERYLEAAETDTIQYFAAEAILQDIKEGLQFVA